jgi:hypothetical protein
MHRSNQIPSRSARRHRRGLPELGDIEPVIDQTRACGWSSVGSRPMSRSPSLPALEPRP